MTAGQPPTTDVEDQKPNVDLPQELNGLKFAENEKGKAFTPEVIRNQLDNSINNLSQYISFEHKQGRSVEVIVPLSGGLTLYYILLKKLPLLDLRKVKFTFAMQTADSNKDYIFSDYEPEIMGKPTSKKVISDTCIVLDDVHDSGESMDDFIKKRLNINTRKILPWVMCSKVGKGFEKLDNFEEVYPPIIFKDEWIASCLGMNGGLKFGIELDAQKRELITRYERTSTIPLVQSHKDIVATWGSSNVEVYKQILWQYNYFNQDIPGYLALEEAFKLINKDAPEATIKSLAGWHNSYLTRHVEG